MIKPNQLLFVAMEDLTHLNGALYHEQTPTFSQLVDAFDNDYGLDTLLRCICCNIDEETNTVDNPVTLLKVVATNVRRMGRISHLQDRSLIDEEEEAKKLPFRSEFRADECFVNQFSNCPTCPLIVDGLYRGVFACCRANNNYHHSSSSITGKDLSSSVITDVELLCVFVALISLRSSQRASRVDKEWIVDVILQSLRRMKNIFSTHWEDWPFTAALGGNEERDERSFDAMIGSDLTDGRLNEWNGVFRAFANPCGSGTTTRVYVGRPVSDLFQYVPMDVHDTLFGEKLASVLRFSYNYSVMDMPYILGSDTNPVIAKEFPAIIPSGCRKNDSISLYSTDTLTLVSRHAIPSSRRLGLYLLKRQGILENLSQMGKAVAECMVDYSIREEKAVITCRQSETRCVERHIQKLFTRQECSENCGMCDLPLELNPLFDSEGQKASYNFFRLHAFMDTFEAIDKTCSASLCPECVIRLVLFVYEKVTIHSGVALSEVFRCPCCDEYLINWLGRGHEFSSMCQRFIRTQTEAALKGKMIKRMEHCFFTLEVLQSDFMETGSPVYDYLPSEKRRFFVVDQRFRPPVRRYKLTEGANSHNRCALVCDRCIVPLSCVKPDEQEDIETIDVAPPFTPYPREFDVEDAEYDDDITDEMIKYDDGPGSHKWPTRLSCGFIASNSNSVLEDVITTCQEAVAVLGRIPKKKIRGWNKASPEGKAVIALANWQRGGTPPPDMLDLLNDIRVAYKENDCLCIKVANFPEFQVSFSRERNLFKNTIVAHIPLVEEFFKVKCSMVETEGSLLKYADLFTRNLVSETLLQMHECVYHRASGFVLKYGDQALLFSYRPDVAVTLDHVKSLNDLRKSWSSSRPSYTLREDRTVEWFVEKGGKHLKTVKCFNCKTAAIKRGGCVSITCDNCGSSYCWLCEKPFDTDHAILAHSLLYCDSAAARRELENYYKIEIATLQHHAIRMTSGINEMLEVYILENGYTFDINENRAVKMKEQCEFYTDTIASCFLHPQL